MIIEVSWIEWNPALKTFDAGSMKRFSVPSHHLQKMSFDEFCLLKKDSKYKINESFFPNYSLTCSAGKTLVLQAGHLGAGMAVKGMTQDSSDNNELNIVDRSEQPLKHNCASELLQLGGAKFLE